MKDGNVLVKVDSSVRELAEGSSLLDLSGLLGVLYQNQNVSAHVPCRKMNISVQKSIVSQ